MNTLMKKSNIKIKVLWCLDVYDNVGSNGIFGAYPSVVKFAGFDILKTHL